MEPQVLADIAVLKEIATNTGKLVADHESRIRKIERWMLGGCGLAAIASLALHFFEVWKK